MNQDAPLTAAVKGYMEEVERLETANDSDAVFKSKMQKAYLTWYRAADDDDDRKLIADSYNVFWVLGNIGQTMVERGRLD